MGWTVPRRPWVLGDNSNRSQSSGCSWLASGPVSGRVNRGDRASDESPLVLPFQTYQAAVRVVAMCQHRTWPAIRSPRRCATGAPLFEADQVGATQRRGSGFQRLVRGVRAVLIEDLVLSDDDFMIRRVRRRV